jgi:FtsP/CotA-like multicopper oxidase with cupredoxin domain
LPRLGRRAFLGALGGGVLATLLPGGGLGRALSWLEGATAQAAVPFREPLPIPPELTSSRIEIPIRLAEQQILPGRKTRLWTFGGSFPGPTVRRPAGERTEVVFRHELPAKVGELTVHLHGAHSRTQFDGQPGGLTGAQPFSDYCNIPLDLSPHASGNDLLIEPGAAKRYVYDLTEDGRPERAAFKWYHDHRLDRTALHAWHGLAGMWIVDDDHDASLPLPAGEHDIPLAIADRNFGDDNQLSDPFTDRRPPADGITGTKVLVNGAFLPHHRVQARRYRLRILNISQFRAYDLYLEGGAPLVQIGADGGLLPRPVRRDRILIGPAERVEVVVDFAAHRGRTVELRSSGHRHGPNPYGSHSYEGPLVQFRVDSRRVEDRTRVPARLRPLPELTRRVRYRPDHTWNLTVGGIFKTVWEINGRTFSPTYADTSARLGEIVTWDIHNRTAVAHVMHLHHTSWYLLARDGHPPPPWEDCLKDTFFVYPGERIRVAGKLSDYTGRFVVHCHMLDHEDHGLMSQFRVVPG